MESNIRTIINQTTGATSPEQNRVLRNTYALLALSMVPTVIGALFGTTIAAPLLMGSPMMSMVIFLGGAFGLMFAVQKTKDSSMGVFFLLAFTLFMGAMLGPLLSVALHFRNGGTLIAMAAGGTGAVFLVLAGVASNTKRDFSNLGKFLFIGLIMMIIASIANMFLHLPVLQLVLSAAGVLIFSGFLLFDINRIVKGGETNYITATLAVYLDIYNLFVNLLMLLMAFAGDRR
ncbi:MAG: Bax inhibitor-1/YccA family protein [Georgfuchsia sp.]